MYSKSCASFSAQVISRVSRSWAKPVMPGRHDEALPVLRDLLAELLEERGRIGRGPTMLMSPRSTFHSCGSSSSLVARRTRPTRV